MDWIGLVVRGAAGQKNGDSLLRPNVHFFIRGLDCDPSIACKDRIIRQAVELDGDTVIVVQSHDLDDPQAVRS